MGHRGSISTTEMESATNEGILFSREVVNGTPLDIQYDSSYVFFFLNSTFFSRAILFFFF